MNKYLIQDLEKLKKDYDGKIELITKTFMVHTVRETIGNFIEDYKNEEMVLEKLGVSRSEIIHYLVELENSRAQLVNLLYRENMRK